MRSHRLPWLLLFLFLVFSTPLGAVKAQPAAAPRLDSPGDVIDAVNGLRVSHGLPPYTMSSILMGTAQGQADYMASIGSVTHTGPGGVSTTNRLLNAGYPLAGDLSLGGFRSENIVGSPGMTAQEAVNAWTGDDPHLHTMLSADLQEIGAGVAEADGVTYYVIDCARPTTSGLPQAYKPGVEAEFNSGDEIIVPVSIGTPDARGQRVSRGPARAEPVGDRNRLRCSHRGPSEAERPWYKHCVAEGRQAVGEKCSHAHACPADLAGDSYRGGGNTHITPNLGAIHGDRAVYHNPHSHNLLELDRVRRRGCRHCAGGAGRGRGGRLDGPRKINLRARFWIRSLHRKRGMVEALSARILLKFHVASRPNFRENP